MKLNNGKQTKQVSSKLGAPQDLQQRQTQHGHRRHHPGHHSGLRPFGAETIHWIVSISPSPRHEIEPVPNGRVVLVSDSPINGRITGGLYTNLEEF
jgi:hypothetical protein